jgi:elongation factor Ts
MSVSAKMVKELRDRTGAGMMDCKRALQETEGDIERAIDILRSKGAAKAAKRGGKSANEGVIGTYLHHNGKIAVLVELNCETDFVANTDDFRDLARDLAMHVASSSPVAVSPEAIPEAEIARERGVYLEQVKAEGKPENIHEKIVEGKLKRWFKDVALLEQPFVKDTEKSVGQVVTEVSAKTGEKIEVARFVRFRVGERDDAPAGGD